MPFSRLQPPLITLTTDFGLADTFVGVMKGVLLDIAPEARLVDLTHAIAPQNIAEASARLEFATDYFPTGTVHLVVVDPGVGSERAACIVETERARFVAPDNGVLTRPLLRQPPVRAVHVTSKAQPFFRQPVSHTFHGRDIFAPVAAHLALGQPLEAFGELVPPESLARLPLSQPEPAVTPEGHPVLRVHLLYADRFGNLITDLTPPLLDAWLQTVAGVQRPEVCTEEVPKFRSAGSQEQKEGAQVAAPIPSAAPSEPLSAPSPPRDTLIIEAGKRRWQGIVQTFSAVPVGSPLAYWGSEGRLELAVRDGSSVEVLDLAPGGVIHLRNA